MEEKKKEFLIWVRARKKQLIVAGVSIVAVIGVILGIKNRDSLMNLWLSLKNDVDKVTPLETMTTCATQATASENELLVVPRKYTLPQLPIEVSRHIRNLAPGQVHSAAKAEEAKALDIFLLPNQTLVDSYTKYTA